MDIREDLGTGRVLAPPRALPQPAERLDPSPPVRHREFELAVERLCLDSTSFRNIRERAGADPVRMGELIAATVAERGKMHNPETDSGGVLLGTVTAVGDRFEDPPTIGDRVVDLASLTLTPLRLDAVTAVDPHSAHVEVEGTAYVPQSAPWGLLPEDIPTATAIEIYDVYGAGSHTRDLAPANGTVCVLGAGHGGKLALAAARDAMEGGTRRRRRRRRRGRRPGRLAGPLRRRCRRRPPRPARLARSGRALPASARPTSPSSSSARPAASRRRSC